MSTEGSDDLSKLLGRKNMMPKIKACKITTKPRTKKSRKKSEEEVTEEAGKVLGNLSEKSEKFARLIVGGTDLEAAYAESGYKIAELDKKEIRKRAQNLMCKVNMKVRIAELTKPTIRRLGMTLETHLAELASIRDLAKKDRQYSAAVSAEVAIGRAANLYGSDQPNNKLVGSFDFSQLPVQDLETLQSLLIKSMTTKVIEMEDIA